MARRRSNASQRRKFWVTGFTVANNLSAGVTEHNALVLAASQYEDSSVAGAGFQKHAVTLLAIRGWISISPDFLADTHSTVMWAVAVTHEGDTLPEVDSSAYYDEDVLYTGGRVFQYPTTSTAVEGSAAWEINIKARRKLNIRQRVNVSVISTGLSGTYSYVLRSLIAPV